MSDKHQTQEPGSSAAELSDEELGDVFGGRMLRIASFYLRNRVKTEINIDQSDPPEGSPGR